MPKHVRFSQINNDLFWEMVTSKGEIIRWSGYNDSYWWNKVSKDPTQRRRTDKDGNVWEIDFQTDEASIINANA